MKTIYIITTLALVAGGCDKPQVSSDLNKPLPKKIQRSGELTAEDERIREEALEEIKKAERKTPPQSVIVFPTVNGWTKPEPRALPEDGLSVAYDHESGMTVTLYQYTRGLAKIPDDIQSEIVGAEFANSRHGMAQAVEMGLMDSLELEEEGIISLGESSTKTHWASYLAKSSGTRSATEVFIWTCNNRFHKIRLSSSPRRSKSRTGALNELLTAIGNASK